MARTDRGRWSKKRFKLQDSLTVTNIHWYDRHTFRVEYHTGASENYGFATNEAQARTLFKLQQRTGRTVDDLRSMLDESQVLGDD